MAMYMCLCLCLCMVYGVFDVVMRRYLVYLRLNKMKLQSKMEKIGSIDFKK